VRVERVVAVIDCGLAVNPDGVRAMTEGAINFGLTAALLSEITIKDGAVEQSNFHDYRVLRLDQAPEVEVLIVPSDREPSGVGELGVTLIGPAVANAVFAATGVRARRLPIDSASLRHLTGSDRLSGTRTHDVQLRNCPEAKLGLPQTAATDCNPRVPQSAAFSLHGAIKNA
jgi:hypothetical protein